MSLIARLDVWQDNPVIEQVAGGHELTVEIVAFVQHWIVRTAEAIWAYLLGGVIPT
jgi:hypothetical protein